MYELKIGDMCNEMETKNYVEKYVEKYVCTTDENFFIEIIWTNGKPIKARIVNNGKEFDITEFIHEVK